MQIPNCPGITLIMLAILLIPWISDAESQQHDCGEVAGDVHYISSSVWLPDINNSYNGNCSWSSGITICPEVRGFSMEVMGPGRIMFAWMKSNSFRMSTKYRFFVDGEENDTCDNIENWGQLEAKRIETTGPVTLKWIYEFEFENIDPISNCHIMTGQAWIAALNYIPDNCDEQNVPPGTSLNDVIRNVSCKRLLLEGDYYEGPILIKDRPGLEIVSNNYIGTTIDGMNSTPCIGIEASPFVKLINLRIINSSIGIQIQSSNNCTIESNTIRMLNASIPRYGVYLYDCIGNTIISNYIESQDNSLESIGIGLVNSSGNFINNQFSMLNRKIIWLSNQSCNNSIDLSHSYDYILLDGNFILDKANGILSPRSTFNRSLSCQRNWSGI